ncbi:MAG TPA: DUF6152 family protein [Steroidobacteraceae bacterium]|jgi:hypothetical protein|nr:DUF6152 family protein [Steroidobacteraceae bacterium]
MKCFTFVLSVSAAVLGVVASAEAHHSYAMFDHSRTETVEGTVAKLEWINPHVYVWVYVKKKEGTGYDLFGFENGPVSMMARVGWTKDSLKPGEKVSVQFFPLQDGRTGGYFIKAIRADGELLIGDTHAPGVAAAIGKETLEKTQAAGAKQ